MKKTLFVLTLIGVPILAALIALPQLMPAKSTQLFEPLSPALSLVTPTHNPNFIYMEFYSPNGYDENKNLGYELHIGSQIFRVCSVEDSQSKTLGCRLTLAEFASISDGDTVKVSEYGLPLLGRFFGSLNKNQLHMTEQLPLVLQSAIDELTSVRATLSDSTVQAQFDVAIQHLTILVDPIYWLDPVHLRPEQSVDFFAKARDVIELLNLLPNVPVQGDNITYFVGAGDSGKVLGVVRSLAAAAYDDSVKAAGGAWNLEALSQLQKGDEAQDRQQSFDYFVSARDFALNRSAMLDDAPNVSLLVSESSPVNVDLHFYIDPATDEDWFKFTKSLTGDVKVSLMNLPANYDLFVYSVYTNGLVGSSSQGGNANEIVAITNAVPGDFYVQVVAFNNASDANNPYTLRFDAPNEPTPTPTATPTAGPTDTPTAPTGSTAKYQDSTSVNFNNGNSWKEVGTWTAVPALTAGKLTSLNDLHVW